MTDSTVSKKAVAIPSGRGIRSGLLTRTTPFQKRYVAIPSGRGIRSGLSKMMMVSRGKYVAIPSGRGIRSGKIADSRIDGFVESQSPLVGAFVPAV